MAASSLRGLLRRGVGFCFGNDDGVERSSGRSMDFGSRFFPACPRCSSVVAGCFEVGAALERVQVVMMTCIRWSFAGARSAQDLHISLAFLIVKVGAVSCLRVWPSIGMCRRGFCSMSVARLAGGARVMCVGLYRFQPVFPSINRAILFFLINENGKYFASFQKKKTQLG